jgi:uncharacterized RDD family membrane protein YckC
MKNNNFTITDDLLATRKQRFFNGILDLLISYVLWISIGTTIVIIGEISNSANLTNWINSLNVWERFASFLVIAFLYYGLTEMYFSRTFAKYFTKTIVVTKNGFRPKAHMILIRTLTRFIPLEALTFLSSNIRGLHDLFSNTCVVKKHEFNKKKGPVLFS